MYSYLFDTTGVKKKIIRSTVDRQEDPSVALNEFNESPAAGREVCILIEARRARGEKYDFTVFGFRSGDANGVGKRFDNVDFHRLETGATLPDGFAKIRTAFAHANDHPAIPCQAIGALL